jgi:hypothetical protein
VEHAGDLVILAKKETVLQGVSDRLIKIRRCYEMEMNVKKQFNDSLKTIIPSTDCDRPKTTGECGIFHLLG